jgi:hypothetical protein
MTIRGATTWIVTLVVIVIAGRVTLDVCRQNEKVANSYERKSEYVRILLESRSVAEVTVQPEQIRRVSRSYVLSDNP